MEIVSDSGEGAQKCGQIFAAVSAKMGNGVWTVEIIPAEIQPPPRIPEGASGNRIRLGERTSGGTGPITLRPIAESSGFLGDPKTRTVWKVGEKEAPINPTAWLPTRRIAKAWEALLFERPFEP